ncbi:MAG: alanine racemase [Clostridia bacterium]|nr:alanine racemase [Clostridia bacterium]
MIYPNRVYAKINLSAICNNIAEVQRVVGEAVAVYAVIKANAYGHGALQVAQALKNQVDGFCVATGEEALALRQEGIDNPMMILGYVFPDSYESLIRQDVALTVFDYESAQIMSETACRLGKTVKVHIKLDTGMGRIGFFPQQESLETVCRIAALRQLEIEGLFSHFAGADEADKTLAKKQMETFLRFADDIAAAGVQIPMLHMCNSAGITDLPEARFNMVRCGIATYGLYPSDAVDRSAVRLTPAMSLHAKVTFVKRVPAGTTVSYGSTFVTERETVIATVPIGYADGYPRSLSGKGFMMIHGQKAPVLGRVCMDQLMVDVTDIPDVKRGDEVIVMGEGVDTETVARLSDRLHYELICGIGIRVPRVYIFKK